MKIALMVKSFPESGGGSERYVWNLAHGLVREDQEVHIYTAEWSDGADRRIRFHRVPRNTLTSWHAVRSFCRNAKRIVNDNRDLYDLVAGFGKTLGQDVYRAGGGCHRVWIKHKWSKFSSLISSFHPLHREILSIEDRIYGEGGPFIICNSRLVASELKSVYDLAEDRLAVVYNGVDVERFRPDLRKAYRDAVREELGVPTGSKLLLFVGHDYERKGLDLLLQALRNLDYKNLNRSYLCIVGRPRSGRKFSPSALPARQVGARADIERYYAAADLLVFPTRYDAFSNVVLEAMATGLPVVTTDANGAAEVVRQGVNGWVVQLESAVEEMTSILASLDAQDLERMGEAARQSVERLTIGENVRQSLAVYRRVAEAWRAGEAGFSLE